MLSSSAPHRAGLLVLVHRCEPQHRSRLSRETKSFSRPSQLDDIFPFAGSPGSCKTLEMQSVESRSDLIVALSQVRKVKGKKCSRQGELYRGQLSPFLSKLPFASVWFSKRKIPPHHYLTLAPHSCLQAEQNSSPDWRVKLEASPLMAQHRESRKPPAAANSSLTNDTESRSMARVRALVASVSTSRERAASNM